MTNSPHEADFSFSSEQAMPAPAQLFRLSGVAIAAAREQSRLRPSHFRNRKARFVKPKSVETLSAVVGNDEPIGVEHKLVGYINKQPPTREFPFPRWSLKLGDSMMRTHVGMSEAAGVATRYSFEWTAEETTRAERAIVYIPSRDRLGIDDAIERFSVADDAVAILDIMMQIEQMTEEDCELLEHYIQDFCRRSLWANTVERRLGA